MEFVGGHGAQQVFLEANSTSLDNVREVRFYDNGSLVSSSSSPPFGASQIFSLGRHEVFAEVIDQQGNHAVSDAVRIDLRSFIGIRPSVEIRYPPAGDIGNESFFPIVAHAFDSDSEGNAPAIVSFISIILSLAKAHVWGKVIYTS